MAVKSFTSLVETKFTGYSWARLATSEWDANNSEMRRTASLHTSTSTLTCSRSQTISGGRFYKMASELLRSQATTWGSWILMEFVTGTIVKELLFISQSSIQSTSFNLTLHSALTVSSYGRDRSKKHRRRKSALKTSSATIESCVKR